MDGTLGAHSLDVEAMREGRPSNTATGTVDHLKCQRDLPTHTSPPPSLFPRRGMDRCDDYCAINDLLVCQAATIWHFYHVSRLLESWLEAYDSPKPLIASSLPSTGGPSYYCTSLGLPPNALHLPHCRRVMHPLSLSSSFRLLTSYLLTGDPRLCS